MYGMSKQARAADVEQSDIEYIVQRQRRQQAKLAKIPLVDVIIPPASPTEQCSKYAGPLPKSLPLARI